MALKRNALYYYLRSNNISSAEIARKSNISRQSFQQSLTGDFWKLRLLVFLRVAKGTGRSFTEVLNQTLKINTLVEKNQSMDEKEFIENLRWGVYD